MVVWTHYEPYVPPVLGPPSEMTAREARLAYEEAMNSKSSRIGMLEAFAAINCAPFGADSESVDGFGRWLVDNVAPDPTEPRRLADHWYSVVFDTGLWVGDLIIGENPKLNWRLQAGGRSHISFQKPVIGGYESDPRYSVDPDSYVAALAHRGIAGRPVKASPIWEYVVTSAAD